MNERKKWIITTAILAGTIAISGVGISSIVKADSSSTPGLADDPVVTKSYVDQKIVQITGGQTSSPGTSVGGGTETIAPIEVVKVPLGKQITVAAGGELIVRTGKAIAFSVDTNGLSDMTDGIDIAPGKLVGNNHLILFPRDGRGVKHAPTSKTELIVLVRGGYQVQ
ncbi:hypothetical protein E5161_12065 [Cohnella pontilimi]|uniref:Uncharacterized protein n=1 Tax=Cohnella pontilimi TaxID=2564100 RepID=A0A4U0FB65_9BACL|nr:hypothetical protein [Cohnella pontilimi]TJY41927.1 hypothetical protein E5161_12065 [Cohnella pontilimi]